MRLLTHNSLRCPAKESTKEKPLLLEIDDFEVGESDFQPEFLKAILPTLDWEAVEIEANAVGVEGIPTKWEESLLQDEDFLKAMHRLLLDVFVMEGTLICQETGKRFPIKKGIANMM